MVKYVIITGGELFNKGAQSMTFMAVDQLKRKFPEAEIVLLSASDFRRSNEEKEQFNFTIMPFSTSWIYDLAGGSLKFYWYSKNLVKKSKETEFEEYKSELNEVLDNAIAWVDISGYALSSQFRINRSVSFLLTILLAKKRDIPMMIMPQSFGPFNYKLQNKIIVNNLMKFALKHPLRIYAREFEGYNYLTNLGYLNNVVKSYDMVLLNNELRLDNIYKIKPEIKKFEGINGVGIVPNKENFNHGNNKEILKTYKVIIDNILNSGKKVVIIRHSHNDAETCGLIKSLYADNDTVEILNEDISSIEFGNIVKQLDFVVGSRFHSIVHSYKYSIPCIALGWATKYTELLNTFEQKQYIFDVREPLAESEIERAIEQMLANYNNESIVIQNKLKELQSNIDLFEPFE